MPALRQEIVWIQIRAELVRLVAEVKKTRHMTQKEIAQAGGLSKQGHVSTILGSKDDSRGPHIINLLKLLKGIGARPSEFFALVERRAEGESPPDLVLTPAGSDEQFERDIGRLFLQLLHLAAAPAKRPRGRPRTSHR